MPALQEGGFGRVEEVGGGWDPEIEVSGGGLEGSGI